MKSPIRRRIQPMVLLAVVVTAPSPSFADNLRARMVAHSNQEGSVANFARHSNQDMPALLTLRDDQPRWHEFTSAVIGAQQATLELPASTSRGDPPDLSAHGNSPRAPHAGGLGGHLAGAPIPVPATLALLGLAAVGLSGRRRRHTKASVGPKGRAERSLRCPVSRHG